MKKQKTIRKTVHRGITFIYWGSFLFMLVFRFLNTTLFFENIDNLYTAGRMVCGIWMGFTVIVVLIAVFLLRGHTMDQRNAAYVEELAQLQNKIDAEEARTQDIADLEAYMQTDEYAEQVAKDKLGLVYEDEIIFKPEEN